MTGSIDRLFNGRSGGNTKIEINIAEFTGSDQDVNGLARKLDDMLRGDLRAM